MGLRNEVLLRRNIVPEREGVKRAEIDESQRGGRRFAFGVRSSISGMPCRWMYEMQGLEVTEQ
jgi:hypothetical protein